MIYSTKAAGRATINHVYADVEAQGMEMPALEPRLLAIHYSSENRLISDQTRCISGLYL